MSTTTLNTISLDILSTELKVSTEATQTIVTTSGQDSMDRTSPYFATANGTVTESEIEDGSSTRQMSTVEEQMTETTEAGTSPSPSESESPPELRTRSYESLDATNSSLFANLLTSTAASLTSIDLSDHPTTTVLNVSQDPSRENNETWDKEVKAANGESSSLSVT